MIKKYGDKKKRAGPNIMFTNNNGLMATTELLEEIYTNSDFISGSANINTTGEPSLREKGKSRADLWAYAALVIKIYCLTK